jgi:hypothetical protein
MMVALSLIALIGMLVLTVDLGRGVAYKRQLVSGADAAALAAAQQCALGEGSGAAAGAANSSFATNVDLTEPTLTTLAMPECDAPNAVGLNTVTVVGNADIDYFFAGIFGIDSGSVAARAVAVWGPVGQAIPIPITVDVAQLTGCGITPGDVPDDPTECELQYPKDALGEPRWGVLDLEQWGDPGAAPCHVDAATLQGIIDDGGWAEPLPANNFDCLDNGLSFSVWAAMEGKILTFPVIDILRSTGTVKPGGGDTPCTGADIPALQAGGQDCQIDTAFVISFITLRVNSVINSGSTVVVDSTFLGPTTGNGIPCDLAPEDCPADFGLRAIRLVE